MARDVPNVEHAANSRAYELYVRNGVQAIQYLSWQLENDPFAKLIFESYDLLVSQLEPIDKTGRGYAYGFRGPRILFLNRR